MDVAPEGANAAGMYVGVGGAGWADDATGAPMGTKPGGS